MEKLLLGWSHLSDNYQVTQEEKHTDIFAMQNHPGFVQATCTGEIQGDFPREHSLRESSSIFPLLQHESKEKEEERSTKE